MEKPIMRIIKIQIPAGKATPAPPVATALGPVGVNLQEFCTKFNDLTRDKMGDVLPVVITVFDDRSFDLVVKTPPCSFLIKRELGLKKAASKPGTEVAGKLTQEQLKKIAEIKQPDLNAYDMEAAMKIVAGTAKNMGIEVED